MKIEFIEMLTLDFIEYYLARCGNYGPYVIRNKIDNKIYLSTEYGEKYSLCVSCDSYSGRIKHSYLSGDFEILPHDTFSASVVSKLKDIINLISGTDYDKKYKIRCIWDDLSNIIQSGDNKNIFGIIKRMKSAESKIDEIEKILKKHNF